MDWSRFTRQAGAASLLLLLAGCAVTQPERPLIPVVARQHYAEGVTALRRSDAEAAKRAFRRAIAEGPFFVEAHRQVQNLRIAALEHGELLLEYTDFQESHPDSAAAAYLLGRLLHRHGDQAEWFEKARNLDPDFPWPHMGLAVLEEQAGNRAAALEHIDQALRRDPSHVDSLIIKGRLLLGDGKTAEAETHLRLALAHDERRPEVWTWLSVVAGLTQRRIERIRYLERALEVDPGFTAALQMLLEFVQENSAMTYGEVALALIERSVRQHPDNPAVITIAARAHEAAGLHESAARNARRAIELGSPDHDLILMGRRMYVEAGRPWAALEFWRDLCGVDLSRAHAGLRELGETARRVEEEISNGRADIDDLITLATALDRAGWTVEAVIMARRVENLLYEADTHEPDVEASIGVILAHARLLGLIRLQAETTYIEQAAGRPQEFTSFIATIAGLVADTTGVQAPLDNHILSFPFLGAILDSTARRANSLAEYFAAHGQAIMAGQLQNGAPQVMVFSLLEPPRSLRLDGWNGPFTPEEVIGDNVLVRPIEGNHEAEVGGRALYHFYYLDVDVLGRWHRSLKAELARITPEQRQRMLSFAGLPADDSFSRRSVALPLDMSTTLLIRAAEIHSELPLLDNVRAHEQGHIFDTLRYLPFWENFADNLWMAVRHGFSAESIMATLEENAQLHALKVAPAPHLVLAEMVRALVPAGDGGPHAVGYKRLLERFLTVLDRRLDDFPGLSKRHMLLHQLHRLSESEIRDLAADL